MGAGKTLVCLLMADGPMWTEKVSAIGTAIGAAGIVAAAVGAWFAFDQLRETRRDRHVQVLSDFGRRWDEDRLAEARDKVLAYSSEDLAVEVEKWQTPPRETSSDIPVLLRIPNFFEDLAIMVECGHLELRFVSKSFLGIAVREWEYWSLAIERMREYEPTSYVEFEEMVRELLEAQKR